MSFCLPTKGLIIRQPWVGLILSRQKTWEMRSKPTTVRGRIALIEAKSGFIVGEAIITESPTTYSLGHVMRQFARHRVEDTMLLEQWRFPWVLEGAFRYEKPAPYNHPRGAVLWVDLTKPGVLNHG